MLKIHCGNTEQRWYCKYLVIEVKIKIVKTKDKWLFRSEINGIVNCCPTGDSKCALGEGRGVKSCLVRAGPEQWLVYTDYVPKDVYREEGHVKTAAKTWIRQPQTKKHQGLFTVLGSWDLCLRQSLEASPRNQADHYLNFRLLASSTRKRCFAVVRHQVGSSLFWQL